MAHGARSGANNALQLLHRHHHDGDTSIAACPAEVGRQISRQVEVTLLSHAAGGFQHHMTAGAFLRMKPEIAWPGLAKTDPVVLSMVASHLNRQAPRRAQGQGVRLVFGTGSRSLPSAALTRSEQVLGFPAEVLQAQEPVVALIPLRCCLLYTSDAADE